MDHTSGSETRRRPDLTRASRLIAIFLLVLVPLKTFFEWPISIIGSVVLTIVLSLMPVLFTADVWTPKVRYLGRLLASFAVLTVGLPLSVIVGFVAGLAGLSCSGGVIGEGCSGGSQLAGLLVGGLALGFTIWLAWAVAPRKHWPG
jgi:hypothetical protein